MQAEDPARVATVRAGLTPEARGDPCVSQGQRASVEHLAHVQRRERNLTRAHQIEIVVGGLIDLLLVRRKEPCCLHRVAAHQHGGNDGREALGDDAARHPLHERELEQRALAHQVREARPAHLDRLLGLDEADTDAELGVIEGSGLAWLADDAQHLVVVLAAHRHG